MWRASPPQPEECKKLRAAREKFDLYPLAIHASYLINLASIDPVIREKSIAGFRGELERALAIGAEYVIVHPGSYKDQTLETGVVAVIAGMGAAAKGLDTRTVTVLLENTVGSGAQIGSKFEELKTIHDGSDIDTGFCLDTCHLLAAGFDVATPAGLKRTVEEADKILGIENVRVFHANDSKGALGSRLDRHMNIGAGEIGMDGFRAILNHPKLKNIPFILETPIDVPADDRRNVDALKSLTASKAR
jgi:deoxyribonuclease-4